jgi:hypothetical protein
MAQNIDEREEHCECVRTAVRHPQPSLSGTADASQWKNTMMSRPGATAPTSAACAGTAESPENHRKITTNNRDMEGVGFAGTPIILYNLFRSKFHEISTQFFAPDFEIVCMEK